MAASFDSVVNARKGITVNGTLNAQGATITAATNHGGNAFPVEQVEHLHKVSTDFGIAATTVITADVLKVIFRATGACTVERVDCVMLDTGSSTDVKFDVLKATAGAKTQATILSATVDFVHGDTDNTAKSGTVASPTLVAGDVLIAHMDFTSATGTEGPMVSVEISEGKN